MSEYQWVHFIALDGPVSPKNMDYMRGQSTRASVSPWEFTNEYNFGDFHGKSHEMLRRGYDLYFHFANYGVRNIELRLPELPCDQKTFKLFVSKHEVDWTNDKRGKAGILTICPEADAGTYEDYLMEPECFARRFVGLREMLLRGDLRPLYVAWLATCCDDEQLEPPVPPGLGESVDAIDAMAELYELPQNMIAAAAQKSPTRPSSVGNEKRVCDWLKKQKKADLHDALKTSLLGDDGERRRLLMQITSGDEECIQLAPPSRTMGDLRKPNCDGH
ncbi:MAG: hypothetical protein ABGZ53_23180 [Fuerstiella sp.]